MKIIIVGCGKVGEKIAAVLSQEGNDIMVIDKDERMVEELCNKYDIMGTVGNGASYEVLLEAEIVQSDLLIAVTGSDELNLLCCLTARMAGNCLTICRLRNPEYNQAAGFLKEELGLAMVINQEMTAAREIASLLKFPSAIEISTFAKGRAELLRFKIPAGSVLDGTSLVDMHTKLHCSVLVCTVERSESCVVIPNGDFVLRSGDIISIVSDTKSEEKFFKQIGIQTNRVKNAMIIGGGDIGYYLAKLLIENDISVKIIEKKLDRCEQLSELLPKAEVICGDGSEQELLQEEGLDQTEGFVALTNIDEENIILSLFARKSKVRKIVTKINRIGFDEVISDLDLDATVHPRFLTAEYILQYVRAMKNSIGSNVETMHWIADDKAEALEFLIRSNFRRTGIPLKDLALKPNILIACINRKGKIILPTGKDTLQVGDTVIVVTTTPGLNDINDIFRERSR